MGNWQIHGQFDHSQSVEKTTNGIFNKAIRTPLSRIFSLRGI
jgi:hypothetical protein